MFCPRCGAENDDSNRFCVSCGAGLAQKRKQAKPDDEAGAAPGPNPGVDSEGTRSHLGEVIGTTRRARVATALTVLAVAIAVVAFIVLRSNDDEGSVQQDAYLTQLDHQCVEEKARLSELETETLQQESPNFGLFVNYLIRDVTQWHASLQEAAPPAAHVEGVRATEGALLEVLIAAGRLATAVRDGSQTDVVRAAKKVDVATAAVDPSLEFLGLDRCAAVTVEPS